VSAVSAQTVPVVHVGTRAGAFSSPVLLGKYPTGGMGVFASSIVQAEMNTPSVATRHLPRKTGEENDFQLNKTAALGIKGRRF
jgi:hypothetical protein